MGTPGSYFIQVPPQPSARGGKGIIAIGQFACGVITISQFGVGIISLSQFTLAVFALAQFAIAYSLIAQLGIFIHEGHGQIVKSLMEMIRML